LVYQTAMTIQLRRANVKPGLAATGYQANGVDAFESEIQP